MARFGADRFPPGFFDLPQGAGETLPLDIIARWTRGTQTRERAREILAPHALRGIVVSSDSAGLTRLTREMALVEILALINRPKEIVHGWGTAIGGRALGIWAADNTQMFYPAEVPAARVAGAALSVLEQVGRECEISIGLCAHQGDFFALGDGLYGPDADLVEMVAEEHTEGGDLLVTGALAAAFGERHAFALEPRRDLEREFGAVLRVTAGPRVSDVEPTDFNYPAPFTDGFFAELQSYTRTRRASRLPRPLYRNAAVVLIERESEERDIPELAVLNDLALAAAMKRIGAGLLAEAGGTEVKTTGLISIYTFEECGPAVAFARAFRDALRQQGIECRIGVDYGQVLTFDLGGGAHDIAGGPVNVASKLAQDVGEYGVIHITQQVADQAGEAGPSVAFDVSGVKLQAVTI